MLARLKLFLITLGLISIAVMAVNIAWISHGSHARDEYDKLRANPYYMLVEKSFHKVRFETLPMLEACLKGSSYFKKYYLKRLATDAATLEHFTCQADDTGDEMELVGDARSVILGLVGDIMWVGSVREDFVDQQVLEYLGGFDVLIGNLETPVAKDFPVPTVLPDYLTYNSPPQLLQAFRHPGTERNMFTAVSLANNHALDQGVDGLRQTMQWLREQGIAYSGASFVDAPEPEYLTICKNDLKIGLYAATYGLNFTPDLRAADVRIHCLSSLATGALSATDHEKIATVLAQMKQDGVDFKILFMHWGFEFEFYPDSLIRQAAYAMVCAGADLVVGCHPHVVQPYEVVYVNGYPGADNGCRVEVEDLCGVPRKALVLYSLGNFVSRMFTDDCRTGAIASLTIAASGDKGMAGWKFNGLEHVYNKVPLLPGKGHRLMMYDDYSKQVLSGKGLKKQNTENKLVSLTWEDNPY